MLQLNFLLAQVNSKDHVPFQAATKLSPTYKVEPQPQLPSKAKIESVETSLHKEREKLRSKFNLHQVELHAISDRIAQRGEYFDYPSLKQLQSLGKDYAYFEGMELHMIKYAPRSPQKGVLVPELWFTQDDEAQIIKATRGVNDARLTRNSVEVPTQGIRKIVVRSTDTHVVELKFYAAARDPILVCKTREDDNHSEENTTLIRESTEIVGYYGYHDRDGGLMGFGLIGYDHPE